MDIKEFIIQIEQQRKEMDALYHSVAVKYSLSVTSREFCISCRRIAAT